MNKILPFLVLLAAAASAEPVVQQQPAEPAAQPQAAIETPRPAVPAPQAAYAALEDALGPDAVSVLVRRNMILLSGEKKAPAVLSVQWPMLEAFIARAKDLQLLPELCAKIRSNESLSGDPAALRRIASMSTAGPVTDEVRSAAALLAAHIENVSSFPPALAASTQKPLGLLAWGADFQDRVHGDTAADLQDAASAFFSEFLYGPHRSVEAESHYLAHMKSVHASDEAPVLESDRAAGSASQRTLDSLAEYLGEQRRLLAADRTRERLGSIEKNGSLRRDLTDVSELAEKILAGPDISRALRFALQTPGPQPRVKFSGAELHVHSLDGKESFDIGDTAIVSLAYWVEGLSPKESAVVTEAGFLDDEISGMQESRAETVKRAGGGPYTVTLRAPLRSAGKKTYRFILYTADGAMTARAVEIEVSPRLEELRLAAAQAEDLAQRCRLADAEKSFSGLEERLAPLEEKPQAREILSWLKPRLRLAAEQAADWKTLRSQLDGVRLYASKEQCDFRADKALRALALLDKLPSGCDRMPSESRTASSLRAELETLLRETQTRRANQDAFRVSVARGRKLESACRHEEAADAFASALALLDSDGEARCGAWETEYTTLRLQDLPRARAGQALVEELAALREKAALKASQKDPAGALAVLNPQIARIDALPDPLCYQEERRKSEGLAAAAGAALPPPDIALTRESLPKDSAEDATAAVAAERSRLDKLEAERRERESKRQEPSIRTAEDLPGYGAQDAGGAQ
ncbi:MAG: hypothetical protein WCU88_04135 [Elusimicrobiota bacterium]